VISSISPLTGYINTVVTITGSGFSSNAVDNFVTLNDKACTVTSASATELKVTIPSKAGSGRIKVKVRELTAETPEFTYLYSLFTKTVFAGSTPSDFNVPLGIALDADGNLLVADFSDRMVKKVTASGAVSVLAGATVGQLINPYGVAADSKGNVYVSDRGDHKIKKITSAGVVSVLAGNMVGEFSTPSGIAVDRDDNIYVADMDNNKIKKITPAGVVSSFIDFPSPVSLAFDGDGNVYVANAYQIKKIVGGVVNPFAGSIQGDDEMFDNIQFITVDNKGTVYVTDHHNFKIKKVSAQRAVSTISNVSNPYGIAVDKNDDLYVAIAMDGVVIKIVQE
jgi:sugar lactone lactonase YvrE